MENELGWRRGRRRAPPAVVQMGTRRAWGKPTEEVLRWKESGGVGIRPFLSSSRETHRGQWHHFCGGLVHPVVVDSVTPWTLSMAQSPEGLSRPLCPWDFPARIRECIAISFSRGSSRPRDRTCVFCIGRRIFTTEPPESPVVPFWVDEILRVHS